MSTSPDWFWFYCGLGSSVGVPILLYLYSKTVGQPALFSTYSACVFLCGRMTIYMYSPFSIPDNPTITMDIEGFSLLRHMARHDLIHLLESSPGIKDLVVDSSIMRPLDQMATMSLLQQHDVAKVYQLIGGDGTSIGWSSATSRRIYLIKPTLINVKSICEHIRAEPTRRYSIVFVPRRLLICDQYIEQSGVYGQVDVHEFDWSLLPMCDDVLSLELVEFARSTFVDNTSTWHYTVAQSLYRLQSLYGLIPTVYGIGAAARDVHTLVERLNAELGEPRITAEQSISHVFLLDRALDHVAPLLTGLTYESMLNDVFGINCNKVTFGDQVATRLKQADKRAKAYQLTSGDEVFASVRNRHMTGVFPYLSAKAKNLQTSFDKGQNLTHVHDMKAFVSKELRALKDQHKSLELHICASEVITERMSGLPERLKFEHAAIGGTDGKAILAYIEDSICQQENEWSVLMLIVMYSIGIGGLVAKEYQSLRSQFVHAYGYKYLLAFHALKRIGLIVERVPTMIPTPSSFAHIARRLNLLPKSSDATPSIDVRLPTEMSYVFSGAYTPALCAIVANTLASGWNSSELRKIFGDILFTKENTYASAQRPPDSRIRKTILVYFIGGVTYAEIAALRLLASMNGFKIVIATTHIIHREEFMKMLADWRDDL